MFQTRLAVGIVCPVVRFVSTRSLAWTDANTSSENVKLMDVLIRYENCADVTLGGNAVASVSTFRNSTAWRVVNVYRRAPAPSGTYAGPVAPASETVMRSPEPLGDVPPSTT